MRLVKPLGVALVLSLGFFAHTAPAVNPIIRDKFAADPTGRVFGDRMYLFSSHDIPPRPGVRGGFIMEDYHVFSSADLIDWTDHGVIVDQKDVPWVNSTSNSMWAPDCVFKDGKYYFYFPANPKDGREKRIGVATADKPEGPYTPQPNYIQNVLGIDPCVLQAKDGNAYLFWSLNDLFCAKLKPNMLEIEGERAVFRNLRPADGKLLEGPFAFERNGKYYLTYPRARSVESIDYAMSDNPMGPYEYKGIIIDEHPSGCWTNHHSIVQFQGTWYIFHHDRLMSTSDSQRSAMIDYLHFNEDGTIQKVVPTLRGVGVTKATEKIQIDRYSDCAGNSQLRITRPGGGGRRGGAATAASAPAAAPAPNTVTTPDGVVITYLDPQNMFGGWKTVLSKKNAWIRYNEVDFAGNLKSVNVLSKSGQDATLEIRLDRLDSAPIAKVALGTADDWKAFNARIDSVPPGKHDIFITLASDSAAEIDWISFE
jgi:hypothetical protein